MSDTVKCCPAAAGRHFYFILAVLCVFPLFAAERNILEEEVKNTESLISEIKRINKRDAILNANEAINHWQAEVFLLRERNSRFKGRASSREFMVYAESQPVADRFLKQAEAVLDLYKKLFPRSGFLPASPAQILVYDKKEDYLKYEHIPEGVAGHTYTARSKKTSIIKRGSTYSIEPVQSSNIKEHRLATYQQEVPYVFAHEVSHILTYELVNPGRLSINDVRTNLFLNEGLAEYFSFQLFPEGLEKRLNDLRAAYGIKGKGAASSAEAKNVSLPKSPARLENFRPQDCLSKEDYPSGREILEFYGEATLFVNWLMQMPDGPNLVGGLLTISKDGQMEALMKQYQRDHHLPVAGWDQYKAFRKEVLLKS